MDLTNEQLERIITSALESNIEFLEICEMVRANCTSTANVWLIGGAVSRTLARELYGGQEAMHDFDFVTDDELVDDEIVPDGWNVSYSKFANPTFTREGLIGKTSVDLWPISSHDYIQSGDLEPTIENLFKGMPYTIQMMAYNIKTRKLVGDVGIDALKKRVFSVNNMQMAMAEATRKGTTVNERMELKAKSMGFGVILPTDISK